MITIGRDICRDFALGSNREWLETNGLGGYALGTISGASTRRYHSLFTVAFRPPVGRIRCVSKIEETLTIDDQDYDLSANQYPGAINPDGYKYISEFRLDPFPIWRFEIGEVLVERKIFMAFGKSATVCRWRVVKGGGDIRLKVRPLIAFVGHHHLRRESADFCPEVESAAGFVRINADDELPPIYFGHDADRPNETGYWYRNFEYAIEKERGFDFHEDLFQPFALEMNLSTEANLIISTEKIAATEAANLERVEIKRRRKMTGDRAITDNFTSQLISASDQFLVSRGNGRTIIAGYPWFSDWGRDTMIALPGLTLATGRSKIAKDILREYSRHVSEGMLPNRFPDEGGPVDYNTADATLWFFEAAAAYVDSTDDFAFVERRLYPVLVDIIAWHMRGTRYGIKVDTDGLLNAGEPGQQLTWMDAKVGDVVITPRMGKAVEIQALWYNALRVMAEFANRSGRGDDETKFGSMADLAKLSFNALFWNDDERCLHDVVINGKTDPSIRPNQIFAVSLRHPILTGSRARDVVDRVEAELLTPYGLRTLSPRDPQYVPYYQGTSSDRDSSYHQGTVWAWLIGPFVCAYRRVYSDGPDRVDEVISGFRKHILEAGIGQVSEIFDAEWPHSPRGCPAQAWSVAELLRILS